MKHLFTVNTAVTNWQNRNRNRNIKLHELYTQFDHVNALCTKSQLTSREAYMKNKDKFCLKEAAKLFIYTIHFRKACNDSVEFHILLRVFIHYLLSVEELSSKQDEFIFLRMGRERCIQSEKHKKRSETVRHAHHHHQHHLVSIWIWATLWFIIKNLQSQLCSHQPQLYFIFSTH